MSIGFIHKIAHRFGWYSGHVVSRTDSEGRLHIGFMCSTCSAVIGEHDATAMIGRCIAAELQRHKSQQPAQETK